MALLCCVCAAAISCSDDDDEIIADDDIEYEGDYEELAPTVSFTTSAGSDSFTITLSASSDAYQYGFAASTSELSLTAEQIIAGTVSGTVSSGVYTASSDGYTQYITVEAEESTTYYIYAAAGTQNGTAYSDIISGTVTTLESSGSGTTTSQSLEYAQARYMGNYYSTSDSGALEYYVIMSDADMSSGVVQNGATYYYLDFWSATAPDSETITLPSGTYTADRTKADFTFYAENSMYCLRGNRVWDAYCYITEGSLTASTTDGITTITGTVTDEEGNSHEITYSGPLVFEDYSTDLCSTLTEDITPDLTGGTCQAACYGNAYGFGSCYWLIQIYNIPGYVISVDLFSDISLISETDLPAGAYTGSDDGATGTYVMGTGTIRDGDYTHSWYLSADENESVTEPYTPIGEGTITISKNEDGTFTIAFDVYDDGGNYTIKTSWTGEPEIYDFSSYYSSPAAPMSLVATATDGAVWKIANK